jgi:hypothetical protein
LLTLFHLEKAEPALLLLLLAALVLLAALLAALLLLLGAAVGLAGLVAAAGYAAGVTGHFIFKVAILIGEGLGAKVDERAPCAGVLVR